MYHIPIFLDLFGKSWFSHGDRIKWCIWCWTYEQSPAHALMLVYVSRKAWTETTETISFPCKITIKHIYNQFLCEHIYIYIYIFWYYKHTHKNYIIVQISVSLSLSLSLPVYPFRSSYHSRLVAPLTKCQWESGQIWHILKPPGK